MAVTFEPLIGFWCLSGFPEDVLNKNINTPQFAWLERAAETRAGEAKDETKKQQNIPAYSNYVAVKAPTDTEKATLQTEEAKNSAEEAKHSAEEAKVILLKTKKGLWRSYS